jgi:hypothetical protein
MCSIHEKSYRKCQICGMHIYSVIKSPDDVIRCESCKNVKISVSQPPIKAFIDKDYSQNKTKSWVEVKKRNEFAHALKVTGIFLGMSYLLAIAFVVFQSFSDISDGFILLLSIFVFCPLIAYITTKLTAKLKSASIDEIIQSETIGSRIRCYHIGVSLAFIFIAMVVLILITTAHIWFPFLHRSYSDITDSRPAEPILDFYEKYKK